MPKQIKELNKEQIKTDLPVIRPGDTIKVYQKIKEKNKERTQVFQGQVIARKHGQGINSTITVRRVVSGVGVEKTFPLHSPTIDKIELVKEGLARRAKLYFLRTASGKRAKLKRERIVEK